MLATRQKDWVGPVWSTLSDSINDASRWMWMAGNWKEGQELSNEVRSGHWDTSAPKGCFRQEKVYRQKMFINNHFFPNLKFLIFYWDFRKGRGTRDQIANIHWIIKKTREFQKNIYFSFIDYAKAFDCVDQNKARKILKEMWIPDHLTCLLRKTCMQISKQQLELDMEQQSCSKLGKECIKAVYCHPAYLTYMQSTSWETLGWKKHKLE